MSNMFGGIEAFQKYMDTEVTSSIKVSDGAPAEVAPTEPVEVLEDNAVTDEKLNQDITDTTDDIKEDSEAIESLGRILVQQMEVRNHLKKHTLTADTYAFLNASYKFRELALQSGKIVPSNEEFSPSSATHRKLVMEASDGMISRIKESVINFFRNLWAHLKKFGAFLMDLLNKAVSKLGDLKNRIMGHKNDTVEADEATQRALARAKAMVAKQRALRIDELNQQLAAAGDDPDAYVEIMNRFEETIKSDMKEFGQGIADRKDLKGDDVLEVIGAVESVVKEKNSTMKFLDTMKNKIADITNKLRAEEDPDKVSKYRQLGVRVNRVTTSMGELFTGLVNSASQLGNRFLQLLGRQKSEEGGSATPSTGAPAESAA